MIGSILLLIVVGVPLEGLPSLNVLAALPIPIAGKLGLSGMRYELVLIIAMLIPAPSRPAATPRGRFKTTGGADLVSPVGFAWLGSW